MQENGVEPTVVMLFYRTHKQKRTGEFVDAKSKKFSIGSCCLDIELKRVGELDLFKNLKINALKQCAKVFE